MIVIGLIGRIAAGKSTVAALLAERGAEVLDADRIAHEVLAEPEVVEGIRARFGPGVFAASGGVHRPALAERVFGAGAEHEAALRDLEALVHPRVRRRIERRLAEIRGEEGPGGRAVVVLDVPLLMQSGWDAACDRLLLVECAEDERRRRIDARGWPPGQRAARQRAWERGFRQPPPEKTTIVDASGDLPYTAEQVDSFWKSLPTA